MTDFTEHGQLLAESQITRLKSRYCRYVDTKQWDALRELFTPEATFEGFGSAPMGATVVQFVAGVSARLTKAVSVHHCHMTDIVFDDPSSARAVWGMEDYVEWPPGTIIKEVAGSSGFRGYGFYEDLYVRTREGWRISFSRLTRLRIDPLQTPRNEISRGWMFPSDSWVESAERAET